MNWFLRQLLLEYFINLRKNVFKICCTLILPPTSTSTFLSSNCFVSLHFLVIFPLNESCLQCCNRKIKILNTFYNNNRFFKLVFTINETRPCHSWGNLFNTTSMLASCWLLSRNFSKNYWIFEWVKFLLKLLIAEHSDFKQGSPPWSLFIIGVTSMNYHE